MGTRTNFRMLIITIILLLCSICVSVALAMKSIFSIVMWVVSALLFALAGYFGIKWYRQSKHENFLTFGDWSGGPEYNTETKQFKWHYQVLINNTSDEQSIGVSKIVLKLTRGTQERYVQQQENKHPYLSPKQSDTLDLVFASGGWIGNEAKQEQAQILLTDSNNKTHEKLKQAHSYSTNFEGKSENQNDAR